MVSLICNCSEVRRVCFDALTALGHQVTVFHSPEAFIDSGAFYETSLLILGRTRFCRTKSEVLQWATKVRPELKTLLLHPDCMKLHRLDEICDVESQLKIDDNPLVGLDAFAEALKCGTIPFGPYKS